MRKLYILAVLILFLGGYGLSVYRMETVLAEGIPWKEFLINSLQGY